MHANVHIIFTAEGILILPSEQVKPMAESRHEWSSGNKIARFPKALPAELSREKPSVAHPLTTC